MNESRAEAEGLSFTGKYSHNKEEVKADIKKMKAERAGCRIILVTIPQNPLSRSHNGTGYSAYADDKYFAYATIKSTESILEGQQDSLLALEKEYKAKVATQIQVYQTALTKNKNAKVLLGKK